jgi:hypothetical protein
MGHRPPPLSKVRRRAGLCALALVAAGAGLTGWWLPAQKEPTPRSPLAERLPPAPGAGEPVAPDVASREPLGALQRRALSLMVEYEARRTADDPVGADAARLRFEEILNDETAVLFVQTLPAGFLESFFGDLALRRWAARDRAAAAAWMAAHPPASPVASAALAHGWVTADPASLHAYLDELPSGVWKSLVACSASEEALVADNPRETLRLLGKIADADPRRDELYAWAVTKWARTEPAAAAAWAAEVPDALLSDRLLAAAAIGHASSSPADAARWAMRTIASPEALCSAVSAIARLWGASEPLDAARWIQTLPPGRAKDEGLENLLSVWAFRDQAQARAWGKTIDDEATGQRVERLLDTLASRVE